MNESGTHETEGTLAERILAAPQLSAAEAAHARVERWLAEIASTAAGKTLTRLVAILESAPERRFADLLADAARLIPAAGDEAEVMRLLRRMRAEAALLIALADI